MTAADGACRPQRWNVRTIRGDEAISVGRRRCRLLLHRPDRRGRLRRHQPHRRLGLARFRRRELALRPLALSAQAVRPVGPRRVDRYVRTALSAMAGPHGKDRLEVRCAVHRRRREAGLPAA